MFRDLWKDGVASSVDLLGEATVTQGEAQRYAERCDEALATLVESMRGWPARPHLETDSFGPLPRANLSVKVSALTPLMKPDAPLRGQRDAAQRLRGLLRRAHELGAHLHIDMESLDSRDAVLELILVPARGGGVPRGPVGGRGPAGLPARLARHAGHDRRVDQRRRRAARPPADRAARQGRLLGPRDRRGRASTAGSRRCSRSRPTPTSTSSSSRAACIDHHADGCGLRAGDRLAQPALGLARDRLQPADRRRRRRRRDADPARARRPAADRDRRPGPARARLLPGRRPRGRHGLPRAAAAREHVATTRSCSEQARGAAISELLAKPEPSTA